MKLTIEQLFPDLPVANVINTGRECIWNTYGKVYSGVNIAFIILGVLLLEKYLNTPLTAEKHEQVHETS